MEISFSVPEKLNPIIANLTSNEHPTIVTYGGRGGGKTEALCAIILAESFVAPGNILIAREIQKSIQDSLHSTLASKVTELGLDKCIKVTNTFLRNTLTGATITFAGLKQNITSIKGINKLRVCFVDEAENVSEDSWNVLRPTLRYGNTRLYVSFNPKLKTDPTYKLFVTNPDDDTLGIHINYDDNPFFPESLERLRQQAWARAERTGDYNLYNWIWLGACLEISSAAILGNAIKVQDFTVDDSFGNPYIGIDWGFSVDPNVVVECYVKGRNLYVNKVGMAHKLPLNRTAQWLQDCVPNILKHTAYADCARPETINQMNNDGLSKVKSCTKTKIVDGVSYLQSFDNIIIHPKAGVNPRSCANTQAKLLAELYGYSYKVEDANTAKEVVTSEILDKNNNIADAIRYALQPLIIKRKNGFSVAG
jgi:phage terminase large subunit